MRLNPVIFADRDGTLIEERGYLSNPQGVKFLPGVWGALRRLKRAGFNVVVISNQSGVGRGLMSRAAMKRVDARFRALLKAHKAPVAGCYYCPHVPAARCFCRKPKTGLLKKASRDLGLPWRRSISVGDRPSDIALGQRAGGIGLLVLTGYGRRWAKRPEVLRPDATVKDFDAAARWILKHVERKSDDYSTNIACPARQRAGRNACRTLA